MVLAYNVATTQMTRTITSYNRTTGAVVMNVTGASGSGTYADWTLSLSPSGGATLGANVFTGVQDWATGANIASASTVNLNTATGNRVHHRHHDHHRLDADARPRTVILTARCKRRTTPRTTG